MSTSKVRLADLIVGLSFATDLAMGQPTGHAVRTCIRAVDAAQELGLAAHEVSTVLYVSLLRYLGCTADAAELAALSGDEIWLARSVARSVMGSRSERSAPGIPDAEQVMAASMAAHCEAAELLAARLQMPPAVRVALRHAFERWDGYGHPAGLSGSDIPVAVRIAVVARDVEIWAQEAGSAAAAEMLQNRRGRAYDPSVVDACRPVAPLGPAIGRQEVLDAEPDPRWIAEGDIDAVLEVFADFADLKAPQLLGHSRRVAALAAAAAQALGLDDLEVQQLRRAGLVHDLGRVAVSASIWTKPSALAAEDWERVRLHPYYTERILQRTPPLAAFAELAGAHHERLDGSGYFRGSRAATLSLPARMLAAADDYASASPEGLPAAAGSTAMQEAKLLDEARAGRLDGRAVAAVLEAAGHAARPAYRGPAGLTEREQQVLCWATRGLTIGQIAGRLAISPKTVDRHLQNSYLKIGVTSRAAAAVFVVSHGLAL